MLHGHVWLHHHLWRVLSRSLGRERLSGTPRVWLQRVERVLALHVVLIVSLLVHAGLACCRDGRRAGYDAIAGATHSSLALVVYRCGSFEPPRQVGYLASRGVVC